jgi:hypothetical protein
LAIIILRTKHICQGMKLEIDNTPLSCLWCVLSLNSLLVAAWSEHPPVRLALVTNRSHPL